MKLKVKEVNKKKGIEMVLSKIERKEERKMIIEMGKEGWKKIKVELIIKINRICKKKDKEEGEGNEWKMVKMVGKERRMS